VYDFLNCLKISPCWGWLNTNETIRKFTTDRAKNLSKVYLEIVKSQPFKNFDVVYEEFPAYEIMQRRYDEGGDPRDLIERCDGFHPNGIFHSYLADWTWNKIVTEHSDWIGSGNPHNDEIRDRFGLEPFL
jgi:acyloxyacyl hydrolase